MGRLANKVALVTGAASGLGAATATLLACEGAKVVLTDLDAETGEAAATAIVDAGCDAAFVRLDVSREDDWDEAIERTMAMFGGLHVLVNNAGVAFPNGSVEGQTLDDWRAIMSVNLEGVFLGTKAGIAAMRKTGGGGSIINFSSILGIGGSATTAAYCASKGGVRLFTKSAALHCAKAGYRIRVNSIHPGYIWTPMLEETLRRRGDIDEERKKIEALTPLGHAGVPDDIAYGVLYLASDESKFVTGTELVIDGGYLAQ